jgi:hypothetical protein
MHYSNIPFSVLSRFHLSWWNLGWDNTSKLNPNPNKAKKSKLDPFTPVVKPGALPSILHRHVVPTMTPLAPFARYSPPLRLPPRRLASRLLPSPTTTPSVLLSALSVTHRDKRLSPSASPARSLDAIHIDTKPLLKGPCLVLVIEWQPRWANCVWCEMHRWLVHRYLCVSNLRPRGENGSEMLRSLQMWWWRSLLHMRHDIESCDQGEEDQDMTWLDRPVASVKGKLSDASLLGSSGVASWVANSLKNDYEIANIHTHGGVHLVVLAHLQRRSVWSWSGQLSEETETKSGQWRWPDTGSEGTWVSGQWKPKVARL